MFYDTFCALCEIKGVKPSRAAIEMGITKGTVSVWKNKPSARPSAAVVDKIANYFGVTSDLILGVNQKELDGTTGLKLAEPKSILVPKLGKVSAGSGCYADNEIVGYESFEPSSIKSGHTYMCLEVQGDSMYPILIEKDLVLIQCQTTCESGAMAVVTVNGDEGVIKKIIYGKDSIELHSINPMYPIRRFEGDEMNIINIIGLVVESRRTF